MNYRKLRPGDWVFVKSPEDILATLDDDGCLDKLPFMPEMLAFCGQRFRVSKRAHKTCDTVNQTGGRKLNNAVHLDDLRCDGSDHGGCDAWCLLFWKEAWLTRVADEAAEPEVSASSLETTRETLGRSTKRMEGDPEKTIYSCQATQLYDATDSLKWWDIRQYAEDLTSGNTGFLQMLRVSFFHGLHVLMQIGVGYRVWRGIYDFLQPRVGGFVYPFKAGLVPNGTKTPTESLELQPGEEVRIKPHAEILETLNRKKQNRGMRFDEEMVPYCGKTFTVRKRVNRIINETTGEMMEMGTPSVIMDGVVCRSEVSQCRLFCPRAIPSYWREIWLERATPRPDQ